MGQFSKTVVGLDVHKDLVVTGVLPSWSDRVTETTRLENTPGAIEKLVKRLAAKGPVEFVYEAVHFFVGFCRYFLTLSTEYQRAILFSGDPL